MGSRNSQTCIYWVEEKTFVVCGCFTGTIEEFRESVLSVHGNTIHGLKYVHFINVVEQTIKNLKYDTI